MILPDYAVVIIYFIAISLEIFLSILKYLHFGFFLPIITCILYLVLPSNPIFWLIFIELGLFICIILIKIFIKVRQNKKIDSLKTGDL
ncbi:MAG: hypothetical protein LBV58_01245 [Acholeplasmatales bacterium]|nr:hypothetical protein [Acholeplasmatales bacterium]